jgi:hypothetical protein
MTEVNWQEQSATQPLFPDIEWSRPQHKQGAGKLLIVGGNNQSIVAPVRAYSEAARVGAGSIRCILPDSTRKIFHSTLQHVEGLVFAASNPSGSLASQALGALLAESLWADHVLLIGDLSKNSETAIVLEKFISKYHDGMTIFGDALDSFIGEPAPLLKRDNTTIVATLPQLQRLAINSRSLHPIYVRMGLRQLASSLHGLSSTTPATFVTEYEDDWVLARHGKVVVSRKQPDEQLAICAVRASVGAMQNPSKWLEGITASLLY